MKENNQTLEEKYIRLYEFTINVLLAHNSPSDFENNYEIVLAKETIEGFKNNNDK